jgi:hypothetical protein
MKSNEDNVTRADKLSRVWIGSSLPKNVTTRPPQIQDPITSFLSGHHGTRTGMLAYRHISITALCLVPQKRVLQVTHKARHCLRFMYLSYQLRGVYTIIPIEGVPLSPPLVTQYAT